MTMVISGLFWPWWISTVTLGIFAVMYPPLPLVGLFVHPFAVITHILLLETWLLLSLMGVWSCRVNALPVNLVDVSAQ